MPPTNHSNSGKTLPIVIAVIVIIVGLGLALALSLKSGSFSNLEPLPTENYAKKPGDFLGNTYSIKAQIDSQIRWEKEVGRILAVRPESGGARLPVFVPSEVSENLHIGQRYEMRARIEEGGLIYVEALRKY